MHLLVIGGTGSVGRHVVEQALDAGHATRALVRDRTRATSMLPKDVELAVGDGTDSHSVAEAVDEIDAVVLTHGTYEHGDSMERVDYGTVLNLLEAARGRELRIALMSGIYVTSRSAENGLGGYSDWKRRAERLVRRSGHPYTIVRPSWFDLNAPEERHLVFEQGDTRHTHTPRDGRIARDQIARVLLASLTSPAAERTTFELSATDGPAQQDLEPLFKALTPDGEEALDGPRDPDTMPLEEEPRRVVEAWKRIGPPQR